MAQPGDGVYIPQHEAAVDPIKLAREALHEIIRLRTEACEDFEDGGTPDDLYIAMVKVQDGARTALAALDAIPQPAPSFTVDPGSITQCLPVTLTYRNWRGEVSDRTFIPKRIWFGSTDWHPEPGWLLTGYDLAKMADRDFALADFVGGLAQPAPAQFLPSDDGEYNGNVQCEPAPALCERCAAIRADALSDMAATDAKHGLLDVPAPVPADAELDALQEVLMEQAPHHRRAADALSALRTRLAEVEGAVQALGALPEGYCFCSSHRIGTDAKRHEPECASLRALIDDVPAG